MNVSIVPQEVRDLVGSAMREDDLVAWWCTSNRFFDNQSPQQQWTTQEGKEKVRAQIQSAKSGDMA